MPKLRSSGRQMGTISGDPIINENGVTVKKKPKCVEVDALSFLPINLSPGGFEINITPDISQIYQAKFQDDNPELRARKEK
ncbi:hypothetical protein TNCV_400011 [Trichonephila clavipes]|nr:hypothetical protein TNCV_400011 [Trichonephila clavipes]